MIVDKTICEEIEEEYAYNEKTMLDVVIDICERHNIDLELCKPLINRSIKEKLRLDFVKLNYLKENNNIIV